MGICLNVNVNNIFRVFSLNITKITFIILTEHLTTIITNWYQETSLVYNIIQQAMIEISLRTKKNSKWERTITDSCRIPYHNVFKN